MTVERESAIVVAVEHPAIDALPHVRQRAESGIPPHITVLYPWRTPPVDEASMRALGRVVASVPEFTITLTTVETFPQGVVYAAVEDASGRLGKLMLSVAAEFPDAPPYRGEFSDVVPHLTLAACTPAALAAARSEVQSLLRGILPLTVPVSDITVLAQAETGIWAVDVKLALGI